MQPIRVISIPFSSHSKKAKGKPITHLTNVMVGLSPLAPTFAMHHQPGNDVEEKAGLACALKSIVVVCSFDRCSLRVGSTAEGEPRLLYYQGWAEGGNYIVLERVPCAMEEANKVACPVTVQDTTCCRAENRL